MAKGLHIRSTAYGPSIYDGRRKVEGPFASLIGPQGAEGRLETLKERAAGTYEEPSFNLKIRRVPPSSF